MEEVFRLMPMRNAEAVDPREVPCSRRYHSATGTAQGGWRGQLPADTQTAGKLCGQDVLSRKQLRRSEMAKFHRLE
jgi:hypothetical protein